MIFDKMPAMKTYFHLGFMLMLIEQTWADQLLPQLLMEKFDTLPLQCRHICMEEFGARKIIFEKMTAMRT